MTLIAYKGDAKLKERFIAEIEKHRKADQIEQGTYGKQNGVWKGCAVACSLRSLAIINGEELVEEYNQHKRYETELGIPEWLARLEDVIFENLPEEEAKDWPLKFAQAIPVGADLEPVRYRFNLYLLEENLERVLGLKDLDEKVSEEVVSAIREVIAVNEEALQTGVWPVARAKRAERIAWSTARSTAQSAAWGAQSTAQSAPWSLWSAPWSAEWQRYAKELLRLLSEAKHV